MLNKKEILKEIKKLMNFNQQNFLDARSGENIVRVEGEDFVIGADIMVVTPDGIIPAPVGEHILEDGRILTVEQIDGVSKIANIQVPEVLEEEEEEVEEMQEITPAEASQEKESAMKKMEDAEKKIEEMEKKILDMEEVVKEMVKAYGKVGEFSKSVENKLDTFIKGTPAEQHFSAPKSEYKSLRKEKMDSELSAIDKIRDLRTKK